MKFNNNQWKSMIMLSIYELTRQKEIIDRKNEDLESKLERILEILQEPSEEEEPEDDLELLKQQVAILDQDVKSSIARHDQILNMISGIAESFQGLKN